MNARQKIRRAMKESAIRRLAREELARSQEKFALSEIKVIEDNRLKKPWTVPLDIALNIIKQEEIPTEYDLIKKYVEKTGNKVRNQSDKEKAKKMFPDMWKKIKIANKQKKRYIKSLKNWISQNRKEEDRAFTEPEITKFRNVIKNRIQEALWYAAKKGKEIPSKVKKDYPDLFKMISILKKKGLWPINWDRMDKEFIRNNFSEKELKSININPEDLKK